MGTRRPLDRRTRHTGGNQMAMTKKTAKKVLKKAAKKAAKKAGRGK